MDIIASINNWPPIAKILLLYGIVSGGIATLGVGAFAVSMIKDKLHEMREKGSR